MWIFWGVSILGKKEFAYRRVLLTTLILRMLYSDDKSQNETFINIILSVPLVKI